MDQTFYFDSASSSDESESNDQLDDSSRSIEQSYSIGKINYDKETLKHMISSHSTDSREKLEELIIQSIIEDNVEALEFFIRQQCNINISIKEKCLSAIHIAYYYDAYSCMKMLTESLPMNAINNTDCYGLTLLHIGCWANDRTFIEKCIENNANINASIQFDPEGYRCGYTALHFASTLCVETVELLLQNGADMNATDKFGRKPLHLVCRFYQFSFFECNSINDHDHLKVLKILLDNGCDVNSIDRNANTPLLSIFPEDYTRIRRMSDDFPLTEMILKLRFLLERGADIKHTNNNGDNVLHRAIRISLNSIYVENEELKMHIDKSRHVELLEVILHSKIVIDVNAKNTFNETPLQLAMSLIDASTVEILLNHDSNLHSIRFEVNDDYCFCYPNSIPTLQIVKNVINIMKMVLDKGFELTLQNNLIVMKFLMHSHEYCECTNFYSKDTICLDWEKIINYASPKHLKVILSKLMDYGSRKEIKANLKAIKNIVVAKQVAGTFIEEDTEKFAKKIKLFSDVDEDEIEEFEKEITVLKSTEVVQNVTLYDVLVMNPHEIYQYVNQFDSDNFYLQNRCDYFKDTIDGHITKSLIRHYITSNEHSYFEKIISFSFPTVCSRIITNYLSNEDIFNLCSAAVLS